MTLSNYQCPSCGRTQWRTNSTLWKCEACGLEYACVEGIPKLLVEGDIAQQDRKLRDNFYDGLVGMYYQTVMPFLTLPARPVWISWRGWGAYALIVVALAALLFYLTISVMDGRSNSPVAMTGAVLLLGAICYFFCRHPYLFYLLILAVPVKISIVLRKFKPAPSFQAVHESLIDELLGRNRRLEVLDIATGTCNSLYRHGWMRLNAHYTGLDLSETMLLQGQHFMALQQIPIDFVLADAARLPFKDKSFDVVLSYGALNGFSDPGRALEEMARVTQTDGVVLFLDEQLYQNAPFVERWYFSKVLSSHNVVHRCPVELIPQNLSGVQVHQVYQFYYLCTCRKE